MDEEQKKKSEGMRTFYRDLQAIETQYQNGILRSVIKEQNEERQREATIDRRKKTTIVWIIAAIVLVIGGVGTVFFAESLLTPPPLETGPKLPSLFPVDHNLQLHAVDPVEAEKNLAMMATQTYVSPSVVRIVPENGRIMTLRETTALFWPETPLLVTTSAQPDFVLGYHTSKGATEPFLVLQARNFAGLQEGMGFWETTLYQDMLVPFNLASEQSVRTEFKDELINNIPVRSLYKGTVVEQQETVRIPVIQSPVIIAPPSEISTTTASSTTTDKNLPSDVVATSTASSTEPAPAPEPVVTYIEETIITKVPGPEERVLFYTIINGAFVVITTTPETLNEIIDRLAK